MHPQLCDAKTCSRSVQGCAQLSVRACIIVHMRKHSHVCANHISAAMPCQVSHTSGWHCVRWASMLCCLWTPIHILMAVCGMCCFNLLLQELYSPIVGVLAASVWQGRCVGCKCVVRCGKCVGCRCVANVWQSWLQVCGKVWQVCWLQVCGKCVATWQAW